MRLKPERILEKYTPWCQDQLGVISENQVWQYRDVSRKHRTLFTRMTGLWRVHHALSEILQLQAERRHGAATGFVAQLLKAVSQVAIDHGSWDTARLLLPTPDPLWTVDFGGEETSWSRFSNTRNQSRSS